MSVQFLLADLVAAAGSARARSERTHTAPRVPQPTWVLCAALLLCGAILVSASTTTDAEWWRLYFSRLGMMGDFSSLAFNGGLVVSGAIIACSALLLRMRLRALASVSARMRWAARLMPKAIVGLGVSLLAIGAFPLSVDPIAHEQATNGAVLSFAALLLTHRMLLWQLSAALKRATLISAVTMIVALVALKAEIISLTVFEAIAFAAILCWVHSLEGLVRERSTEARSAAPASTPVPALAAAPAQPSLPVALGADGPRMAAALALSAWMPQPELEREVHLSGDREQPPRSMVATKERGDALMIRRREPGVPLPEEWVTAMVLRYIAVQRRKILVDRAE